MANELYVRNGTNLLINGEAAGVAAAWSVEGLANAAGRVSAQLDLGAAPRAYEYAWSCEVMFQATPTQTKTLDLFIATAPDHDATQISGDVGNADAALGDVDMRYNLRYIGSVTSENAAAGEKCVASGSFFILERYVSFIAYNDSGAAVNATDSNFRFDLTPKYYQGQ